MITQQDGKELEALTRTFLQQCVDDGRLTKRELAEISLDRETSTTTIHDPYRTYKDFVRQSARYAGWPLRNTARSLHRRRLQLKLSKRDIEWYINLPAFMEREIAKRSGLTRQAVTKRLKKLRHLFLSLRLDGTKHWGVPALRHMKRIETTADSDDRLNGDEVIRF